MDDPQLKPLEVTNSKWYSSFLEFLPQRYWLYILLGVFALNSLILDAVLFAGTTKKSSSTANPVTSFISQNSICPQSCVDQINSAIALKPAQTASVSSSPSPTPTPTLTPTPSLTPTPTPKSIREYFVPLGIGSSNAGDWTSIPALGATIDPSDYGNIVDARFEITIRVPTGNETVWVRLIQIGNYSNVNGSEMNMSGGTPVVLVSAPISFLPGQNFYQVQMKTQLQYPAYVDQARIRIKSN